MAGKRLRRRAVNVERVRVLASSTAGWEVTRHVDLEEALRKIARQEWRAIWYEEDGGLAGVEMKPPVKADRPTRIRCGSVECLKGWVMIKRTAVVDHSPKPVTVSVRLKLFLDSSQTKFRKVSAELALRKIALSQWKAIWYESGELAGVAAL